jgi:VWFA-related protein
VVLLALFLSPAFSAQQSDSQGETTVSTTTELVLVPAQVKGKDGKPLLGLKAEDFVVRSDGKPQPIRVFEETAQNASAPQRITNSPPATADTIFNVPDGGMPDRILIIALDLVNTPAADQARARRDLLKYLTEQQATHQHFALVTITRNGLSQIHNFSSDPAVLVEALKKIEANPTKDAADVESLASIINAETFATSATAVDVYQSMLTSYNQAQIYGAFAQKEAARATLTAMKQIAQAYAGVPGRKAVIWLTDGMPTLIYNSLAGGVRGVSNQVGTTGAGAGGGGTLNADTELLDDYDSAFRALNNANIAIYGVDLKGIHQNRDFEGNGVNQQIATKVTATTLYGGKMIQPGDYQDDAIKVVSHATGGKSCTANAGLKDCMDQAVADSSSYYMLGFYVPQQDRKAGWHKLEVKLNSEKGSVRSRNSYYLAPTAAPTDKEINRTLWDAANARIGYTGLAFAVQRVAADPAKSTPAGMRIFVPARSILMSPGHPQLSYDIVSVSLNSKGDPDGKLRVVKLNLTPEQTQSALNKGWSYVDQPDGGGKQPVKYILRDTGTGRIGSLVVLPQQGG